MLGRQGYDVVADAAGLRIGAGKVCGTLDREVVGFGCTGSENDLSRVGLDQRRNLGPRLLDRIGCYMTVYMAGAVRVAEMLGKKRQHCFEHSGIDRRCRLIV